MRTTIDLSDRLFKRAKATAALKGISLKQLIARAIERELITNTGTQTRNRIRFPLVASHRPGSVNLTSERVYQLLEDEDIDVRS